MTVEVVGGHLILEGTIYSLLARKTVSEGAALVRGVVEIDNRISVNFTPAAMSGVIGIDNLISVEFMPAAPWRYVLREKGRIIYQWFKKLGIQSTTVETAPELFTTWNPEAGEN